MNVWKQEEGKWWVVHPRVRSLLDQVIELAATDTRNLIYWNKLSRVFHQSLLSKSSDVVKVQTLTWLPAASSVPGSSCVCVCPFLTVAYELLILLTHHVCFLLPIRLSSLRMKSTLVPSPPTRLAISQKKSWKNTRTLWRENNRAKKVSYAHPRTDIWQITGYISYFKIKITIKQPSYELMTAEFQCHCTKTSQCLWSACL